MMIRTLLSTLVGVIGAVSSALAGMPNPHAQPWSDRRHVVIGSDLEPQHYATAEIFPPDADNKVNVLITCENGTPGSSWSGFFNVFFRQGDVVLASTVERCQINRSRAERHKKYSRAVSVDLSKVICRVDNIQTSITPNPIPIKPLPENSPLCEASADLGRSIISTQTSLQNERHQGARRRPGPRGMPPPTSAGS